MLLFAPGITGIKNMLQLATPEILQSIWSHRSILTLLRLDEVYFIFYGNIFDTHKTLVYMVHMN
jgi:hypothetical protein